MARRLEVVDIDRIFIYEENPRHEPFRSEPEIIDHLCQDEQVFNLARSIAEAGTNPLDLVGLIQLPGSGTRSTIKNYQAWEGNRRICAIKLLNDPDRAPAHLRKEFARLASTSGHIPVKTTNAVIFDDQDDLRFWMGIIHDGEQAGVGRLRWDAEQKARHFGSNRNRVALAVLDAAEGMGLISKEERSGKLTTAQRFLNRSIVREALGIDASNLEDIAYNRPLPDLRKQLSRFISDLKQGAAVTSRMKSDQIDTYGRKLAQNADLSGERTEPLSLSKATAAPVASKSKGKTKPTQPRPVTHIEFDKGLSTALDRIGAAKLTSLYYSICDVHLDHTPLLVIGAWAFVESLTALAGRHSETDFVAYFSNQRLATHGFSSGKAVPLREALTRIQRNGNATKHHEIAATFEAKQLANDMATVTPLLLKVVESIASKK